MTVEASKILATIAKAQQDAVRNACAYDMVSDRERVTDDAACAAVDRIVLLHCFANKAVIAERRYLEALRRVENDVNQELRGY